MVLPPGWSGGGGGGANLGTAQGAIVVNTSQLQQALGQVRSFANQVNSAMGKIGQTTGGTGGVATQINQATSAMDALAAKAKQVALALGALQIGGWAMQTSQALTQAQVRFEAITGSASAAADQVNRIRVRARELGVAANETLDVFAGIAPLIEEGKSGLDSYVDVMARLAVLDPAQGLRGAAFAVREALASLGEGRVDFRSLSERFEIAKPQLRAALEATGGDLAAALDIVLNKMGITEESAERMAKTFLGASRVLKDEIGRTLAITFGPFFDKVGEAMLLITNTLARINDIAPGLLSTFGAIIGAVSLFATLNAGIPRLIGLLKSLAAAATLAKEATAGKFVRAGAAVGLGVAAGIGVTNLIGRATGDERLANATIETLLNDLKNILNVAIAGLVTAMNSLGATFRDVGADISHIFDSSWWKQDESRGMFKTAPTPEFFNQIFKAIYPDQNRSRSDITELVQAINRGEFTKSGNALQGGEVIQISGKNMAQLLNDVARYFATASDLNLVTVMDRVVDKIWDSPINKEMVDLLGQFVTMGLSPRDASALQSAIEATMNTNETLRRIFGVEDTTSTSAPSGPTPLQAVSTAPTDEMLQATKDYLDQSKALDADFQENLLKAETDNEEKRLAIIEKYGDQRAAIEARGAERRNEAAIAFAESYADIVAGRNESIAEAQQRAAQEEIEREDKKRKDLEKLDREHRMSLFEAAANLDARAVEQENRRYREQLRNVESSNQDEKAKRQKALDDQLRQIDDSTNKQILRLQKQTQMAEEKAQRRDDAELARLAEQEAKEQAQREAAYQQQVADLYTQYDKEAEAQWNAYVDQLAALGDHNAQMLQLARDGYQDLEAEYEKLIGGMKAEFERMKIEQSGSLAAVNMGDPAAEQAYYDSLKPLLQGVIPQETQKLLEGLGIAASTNAPGTSGAPDTQQVDARAAREWLASGMPWETFLKASTEFVELIKRFKNPGEDAEQATQEVNAIFGSTFENLEQFLATFNRVKTDTLTFLTLVKDLSENGDLARNAPKNISDAIGQVFLNPDLWLSADFQGNLNAMLDMISAPAAARANPEAVLAYAMKMQQLIDAYDEMANVSVTDDQVSEIQQYADNVRAMANASTNMTDAARDGFNDVANQLDQLAQDVQAGDVKGAELAARMSAITSRIGNLNKIATTTAEAATTGVAQTGQAATRMIGTVEAVGRGVDKMAMRAKPALDTVPNNLMNFANGVANVISGVFGFINRITAAARQGPVITQQTQNQAVRPGQLMVTQFAGGSNGVPYTGLFGLHKKEIVLDPRVSEMARAALGPNVNERLPGALGGGLGGGLGLTWNGNLIVNGTNATPEQMQEIAVGVVVGAFEKLVRIRQEAAGT